MAGIKAVGMAAADLKKRLGRFADAFKADPKNGRHVAELLDLCRQMTFDTLKKLRDDVEFLGAFDTFYTVLTNYVSQKMAAGGGGGGSGLPLSEQVTRAVLLCCSFKRYTETLSQSTAASSVVNTPRPPPLSMANMPFLTTMAWNQWLLGGTDLPEKPCYYEPPLDFKINTQ